MDYTQINMLNAYVRFIRNSSWFKSFNLINTEQQVWLRINIVFSMNDFSNVLRYIESIYLKFWCICDEKF